MALRLKNTRLKVMLSVGGWNAGSHGFSQMVSTRLRRKTFIESAMRFLRKHNFDGLDINWEFPGVRGGKENDKGNFEFFLQVQIRFHQDIACIFNVSYFYKCNSLLPNHHFVLL
jgi:GH18 family chitinase